jgi:cyclic beta-1,2-glucan synthetase
MASNKETALALAQKYRDPSAAARTFALTFTRAQSDLRHLRISGNEALLYERLASRVLYVDGSLRASPEVLASNVLGQEALWPYGISGDLPIVLVRVGEESALALIRQVLEAQGYWRLKGLSADVVILNEHPAGYLDETHAQITAVLDNGPWSTWKDRPSGCICFAATDDEAERTLLASVARAAAQRKSRHWPTDRSSVSRAAQVERRIRSRARSSATNSSPAGDRQRGVCRAD